MIYTKPKPKLQTKPTTATKASPQKAVPCATCAKVRDVAGSAIRWMTQKLP